MLFLTRLRLGIKLANASTGIAVLTSHSLKQVSHRPLASMKELEIFVHLG